MIQHQTQQAKINVVNEGRDIEYIVQCILYVLYISDEGIHFLQVKD